MSSRPTNLTLDLKADMKLMIISTSSATADLEGNSSLVGISDFGVENMKSIYSSFVVGSPSSSILAFLLGRADSAAAFS